MISADFCNPKLEEFKTLFPAVSLRIFCILLELFWQIFGKLLTLFVKLKISGNSKNPKKIPEIPKKFQKGINKI